VIHPAHQTFALQVYISATLGKASVFASESWCTIPFELTGKSARDELIDILLWIPNILDTHTQWFEVKDTNLPEGEMLKQQLALQIQYPISKLSDWWAYHGPAIFGEYDYANYVKDPSWTPPQFYDTNTASNIAFYNTANIFVYHMQSIGLGMPTEHLLTMHASSVLAAARFHQSQGPQSGGTFTMVYPLKAVCMMTSDDEQRKQAQAILLEWGKVRGVDGACKSAAPQYTDKRREKRARL
jgi:hypothetical protein